MQRITVHDYINRYLDETKAVLKSHYSVASVLHQFQNRFHQNHQLRQLDGPAIHAYVQTRLNQKIKPNTINRELSVISAAINYARRKHGINMANPVQYQWLKAQNERLRYLQKSEAKNLIDHAGQLRPDLANFIQLALHTGCRKSELLMLKWSDVDPQNRYILLRPEQTKAGRRRLIPLNNTAKNTLQQLKANNPTDHVFIKSTDATPVKTYNWLFRKACDNAGIHDFRIHDLRHTFASWLVSEGVPLEKVRDLLGHRSIKQTERYAHLMPDRLAQAVAVLDLFA